MSLLQLSKDFGSLKGQTVVISGGASGIGEAFVRLAQRQGASVFFGDLDRKRGEKVAEETGATFVCTNVTQYQDQLDLFGKAFKAHGRVDHAIANAGIYEPTGLFDPSSDLQSLQKEPPIGIIDVNLRGAFLFAHIAAVYLQQGKSPRENNSLVFVSSTAGILCPPGTPAYNTTKSGMLGLSRSLAQSLPASHGIRVNCVCPSVTATPLSALHVLPMFELLKLPVNSADDLAQVLAGVCCDSTLNGKVLYVEGGKSWDIEEGLAQTRSTWLGAPILGTLDKVSQYLKQIK